MKVSFGERPAGSGPPRAPLTFRTVSGCHPRIWGMPPRLSALDPSFLYLEQSTTPMHVGAVSTFRRPRSAGPLGGFDYDRLVELIEQRIALVPRYRQKVRYVPGNLARPVWIDDPDFD